MNIKELPAEELRNLKQKFENKLNELRELNLNLDMTRGKPSKEQLDLSSGLDGILQGEYLTKSGLDTRNYGVIDGIPEAQDFFASILEVPAENILVGGNSSLTLMYQYMSHANSFGINGPGSAWKNKFTTPSFICPSPGYDRHFAICEFLGIKMHPVEMDDNGPKMDQVENLIKNDSSVCGMWCVPKYSNPTGVTYSDEVVERISKLSKITHSEFRIFWDNAYILHSFNDTDQLKNIFDSCSKNGTEDSVVEFASTSKITFAGAGVSFMSASKKNLAAFKKFLSFQTIGPDKVNQLRHLKFFADLESLKTHMKQHAEILKPKFDKIIEILESEIGELQIARWSNPSGGYFISLDTIPDIAKSVVEMCASLGVKFTPAGSTFPYNQDPLDSNIRIAPSMPNIKEIELATRTLSATIGLLSINKIIES